MLSMTTAGYDPVIVPVRVTRPSASLFHYGSPQLHIGEIENVSVNVTPRMGCGSNTNGPVLADIGNSNPGAVTTPPTVDLATLDGNNNRFPVTAIGEGVAIITIQPPDGFTLKPPVSLTFSSRPKAPQ